jgi:hypothetical protein
MAGVEERNIAQGRLPLGAGHSEYLHMGIQWLEPLPSAPAIDLLTSCASISAAAY